MAESKISTATTSITIYQAVVNIPHHGNGVEIALFGTQEEADAFLEEELEDAMAILDISDVHDKQLHDFVEWNYEGSYGVTKVEVSIPIESVRYALL